MHGTFSSPPGIRRNINYKGNIISNRYVFRVYFLSKNYSFYCVMPSKKELPSNL